MLTLEDDAYLDQLVDCNRALGSCLGVEIRDRGTFEESQSKLKNGEWAPNALEIARSCQSKFSWLLEMIGKGKDQRCPVWEQFAADLAKSTRYIDWLFSHTAVYLKKPSKEEKKETPHERVQGRFAWVLTVTYYQLCSEAALYQAKVRDLRAKGDHNTTWLKVALDYRRSTPGREARAEAGLPKRLTEPGTAQANSETPAAQKSNLAHIRPETDVFAADAEAKRPPDPATDKDETPDEILQIEERDARIRRAKAELPGEQQLVLYYRIHKSFNWKKTAEEMGLTDGKSKATEQAKTIFKRAVKVLRAKLAGERE